MSNDGEMEGSRWALGPIHARGAVLDDFEIIGSLPPHEVPLAIEKDRPFFVAQSGFRRKLLPLRIENDGRLFSGGRYMFGTFDQAQAFARWIEHDFRPDGKLFIERPWVRNLTCVPYHVIGAHDFKSIYDAQVVVRVERWTLEGERSGVLESAWPGLRERAGAGLASVWLLYSDERREAALITVADRIAGHDPTAPDVASVRALETHPSLAAEFAGQAWARKTFDRTSWVFTIWFAPDHRPLDLWPNSPPLPGAHPVGIAQESGLTR
jgi:hypothetical protein